MNAFQRTISAERAAILSVCLLLLFACTEKTYVTNPPPVIPDLRPPLVEWVSVNGRIDFQSVLSDTVTLTISATDDSGIDSVKLYINGFVSSGADSYPPHFIFLWPTLSDSDGTYSLEARAWDKAGNVGETPTLLVRVSNTNPPPPPDRTPPVIRWISPAPGNTIRDTVALEFVVTDSSHLDSILVFIDGKVAWILAETENSDYTIQMNSWRWINGLKILEVRAYDAAGNTGIGNPVGLTIDNHRVIWVPNDYETIQGAINASVDGDTVRVRAGTYHEGLRLMGKNIWLESEEGPESTIVEPTSGYGILVSSDSDSATMVIRGFTVKNGTDGIQVRYSGNITFCNNIVLNSENHNFATGSELNASAIFNNVFDGSDGSNIYLYIFLGSFYNNVVINSADVAFWNYYMFENTAFCDYNLVNGYRRLINEPLPIRLGPNNLIGIAPVFFDGTYLPRPESPLINAGNPEIVDNDGSRSDIGVYGGPFAYPLPSLR